MIPSDAKNLCYKEIRAPLFKLSSTSMAELIKWRAAEKRLRAASPEDQLLHMQWVLDGRVPDEESMGAITAAELVLGLENRLFDINTVLFFA